MRAKEWYEVLGLDPHEATEDRIQEAYRRLARESHPDVGGDPELFRQLNAARDTALHAVRNGDPLQREARADERSEASPGPDPNDADWGEPASWDRRNAPGQPPPPPSPSGQQAGWLSSTASATHTMAALLALFGLLLASLRGLEHGGPPLLPDLLGPFIFFAALLLYPVAMISLPILYVTWWCEHEAGPRGAAGWSLPEAFGRALLWFVPGVGPVLGLRMLEEQMSTPHGHRRSKKRTSLRAAVMVWSLAGAALVLLVAANLLPLEVSIPVLDLWLSLLIGVLAAAMAQVTAAADSLLAESSV